MLHLTPHYGAKDDQPKPDKVKNDAEYTLADVYDSSEYGTNVLTQYEYDHGDGWDHAITFFGRADPNLRVVMRIPDELEAFCMAGEGHPCAEDCRSNDGWVFLKSLFKGRKKDPEGRKAWYKEDCANGDPTGLDPYQWDMFEVNGGLLALAKGELEEVED